jgi:hypothetical protein
MYSLKSLITQMGEFYTTPLFWACRCEEEYIHPASQEACYACNCRRETADDAKVDDVLHFACEYHLPIELVRVVECAAETIKPDLVALISISS